MTVLYVLSVILLGAWVLMAYDDRGGPRRGGT